MMRQKQKTFCYKCDYCTVANYEKPSCLRKIFGGYSWIGSEVKCSKKIRIVRESNTGFEEKYTSPYEFYNLHRLNGCIDETDPDDISDDKDCKYFKPGNSKTINTNKVKQTADEV